MLMATHIPSDIDEINLQQYFGHDKEHLLIPACCDIDCLLNNMSIFSI